MDLSRPGGIHRSRQPKQTRRQKLRFSLSIRVTCMTVCIVLCGGGKVSGPVYAQAKSRIPTHAASLDLSTPQKTVIAFLAALKKGQMETAAKCVVNGKPCLVQRNAGAKRLDITLKNVHFTTEGERVIFTG